MQNLLILEKCKNKVKEKKIDIIEIIKIIIKIGDEIRNQEIYLIFCFAIFCIYTI